MRPRLLKPLAEATSPPITVVTGPPGSGKTTLLSQYAAAEPGRAAFYSFSNGSVDPEKALTDIHGLLADCTGLAPAPTIAGSLFAVVEQLTFPVTLVLDDVHLIEGTPMQATVSRLAAMLPRRGRLLIAARTSPDWLVATLRDGIDLKQLTAEDLRFRSWEVEQLFGLHYKEPLPPEDAAALCRETEGWAAGLQMFYLSTSGKSLAERKRAVAELWGKASLLTSYLTATVLAGLPAEIVEFMVQTSAIVDLDPLACDRFLDRTDSAEILEELAGRQLFTIRTDAYRYRYHAVLQGQLETMLVSRMSAKAAQQLYRRAAVALQDVGRDQAAVRAWIRAGDWGAAEQIRQRLNRSSKAGATSNAETDRGAVPSGLETDPWVRMSEAHQLLADGRLAAAREAYRQAEVDFIDPAARKRCRTERLAVEAFLGIGAPYAQERSRDWAIRLRAATRAQPSRLWQETDIEASDGWRLAATIAAMLDGNFVAGSEIASHLLDSGSDGMRLAGRFLTAIASGIGGNLDSVADLDEVALDAEAVGQLWISRLASAQRGFFDPSAAAAAGSLVAASDASGDQWGALFAALAQAIGVALDEGESMPLFDDVVERAENLDAAVIKCWALAFQSWTAARAHLPEAHDLVRRADESARLAGVGAARAVVWYAEAELDPSSAGRLRALAGEIAARNGWGNRVALAGAAGLLPAIPQSRAPEEEPAAKLRCLGGFSLELHGEDAPWRALRPRVAAMLRLLALHMGKGVHEERIIDALWPDQPPERGRHSLQAAVSSLRHELEPSRSRGEPSIVERVGESYALRLPEPCQIDLIEFRQAIDEWHRLRLDAAPADHQLPVLARALAAYTGELLPEDGPAEWVVEEREQLRLDAAEAATALAAIHHDAGDATAAIRAAERALRIDSSHDQAWRVLLAAHEERGDVAAVERVRRRYTTMLDELGIPATPPS
ncbi:MAG TPA: winged helix-turn-helix domain-containing protein [Mycobacteriales bacterium]|nr:winged helix-turn-helix domain-containing protein [Mycobacteriales bacterium]